MSEKPKETSQEGGETGLLQGKQVSRREFMKLAGIAGAAVGMGAGLGGLVAACGGTTTTTTTAPASTTSTSVAASTTTVTAAPETGAEIKIGFITPKTGGLASFGVPDGYTVDRVTAWIGDGQVLGDSKKHPITISVQDSQSDTARVGQVAGTLIGDGIDIMCVASGPDTVNPTAAQCEANGVPMVATDDPWEAFIGSAPTGGVFKWCYLYFFGVEDIVADYVSVWSAISTNKVMGAMWPNDADGAAFSDPKTGFPPVITGAGFKLIDAGRWQDGTEDFTAEISKFKSAGCEVLSGVFNPPDFTNFWKQCKQQGWSPKIATIDKAILFPQSIEALGPPPIGIGLISGDWWDPKRPWKSYLTGDTCQQWADDYSTKTGQQWTQPLMHVVTFEMAIWALQHATDPTSKDAILAAIKQMKFTSIGGDMDFSAPVPATTTVGQNHVHPNVYKSPACAGQWVKGTTNQYDYVVVNNTAAPMVLVEAQQIAVPA